MIELSRAQKQIQKAARDFAKGEFQREMAREAEKEARFPEAVWQRAAELGFVGIQFPEDFSGGGLGLFEAVLLAEALCAMDSSLGLAVMEAAHGAECIARFGSDEQKNRYLRSICEGETCAAAALTEADRGPNGLPAATAVPNGDGWRLSGTKDFVAKAERAGVFVVLALDAPEAGTAGMFLVDAGSPGITLRPEGRRLGDNFNASAAVDFADVALTAEGLLGKPGKGLAQLESYFIERRILTAGLALGIAQGALERAVDYIKQRVQFSRKIGVFQVTRHKIADMACAVETARSLTYAAARAFDRKRADSRTAALAKLTATEAAIGAADEAIQLHGGYGYMREYDVERSYRDAKALSLTAGAPGDLRDVIGAATIGRIR